MAAPTGQPVPHTGAAWELRRLLAPVALSKAHAVLHAGIEEREGGDPEAGHQPEAIVHAAEGVVLGEGTARRPEAGALATPGAAGGAAVSPLPLVLSRRGAGPHQAHAEETPGEHATHTAAASRLNGAGIGGRLPCGCPVDPAHAAQPATPSLPTQAGRTVHTGGGARNREAPATPAPTVRNAGEAGEPGQTHYHVHSHTLAIPSRREDFRGILGDLERSVKPYLNEKGEFYSKDSDQSLPMYRVAAALDPQLVAAYTLGASFLYRAGKYPDAALAFLLEGERNNPSSFEIQVELGHIYLVGKKDYARAAVHLLHARELVPRDLSQLTPTEQQSLADLYRWLALTYREWQRPGQALTVAREGLRLLGEDGTLSRIVRLRGR